MPPRKRLPVVIDAETVEPEARKWDMDLDELNAQVTEAVGSAPAFTIRLPNDDQIVVRHPVLMSDEATERVALVENSDDLDRVENTDLRGELAGMLDSATFEDVWKLVEPHVQVPSRTLDGKPAAPYHVRLARAILGEEDYVRLLAGGGNANSVLWAFGRLNQATNLDGDDPKSVKS